MAISGLVIALAPEGDGLAQLRRVPGLTLGPQSGPHLAAVLETADDTPGEDTAQAEHGFFARCEALRALPGIADLAIACVHYDDGSGAATPFTTARSETPR